MHDKLLMFLDKLHGITSRQSGKLSSFFVQRSIYLAYFGQDLSISCDAMQTVPEENSIYGISMRVEPAAGEAFAGLESTVAARVLDSAAKEKELQEKFDKFKQLEVEQVIRLEHLATVEQENRGRIDELKRQAAAAGEDVDGTGRLVQVSVQLSEKRNELIRLEAMERDKRSVVRQLEEEERRLHSMVDDFTAKVRALSAEKQAKANSAAAIEQQHRSTVEKLTNKELSLRRPKCRGRERPSPLRRRWTGRASHEGGRSATTEQAAEADVQEETNGGPGLEDMIRDASGPEEDHPTQAEDVPLPLFSRGIPAAEGEMEASAEV
ncbi:hypothetical protein MY4038_010232 [Beauveria bassiana]